MLQNFTERVIKIALEIPKGRVTTYGRIARAAGAGPMAAQSITNILGKAYMSGVKDIPFIALYILMEGFGSTINIKRNVLLYIKKRGLSWTKIIKL